MRILLLSLFPIVVMTCACADQISMEMKNPGGAAISQWPVTTGIPFPPGVLTSPEEVRLMDAAGIEIPLQVARTGVHQDGSVRWLLLDFQTDVPREGRKFTLEFGKGTVRAAVPQPLQVSETDVAIQVNTGPMRFAVSKKRFNGMDGAWIGDKPVIIPASDGGPYFVDDQGREFRACLDPASEVAVESQGPLRTVITARGWCQDASGAKKCRYIVRIHAFAGKPYVRIFYTWIMTEDSRKLRFRDIGFRLPMNVNRCAFGVEGEKVCEANVAGGDAPYLLQYDCDKFRVFPESLGAAGAKAQGWIAADGPEARCTLLVKDFWQLFPKELGADAEGVTFHMWPAHGMAVVPNRKVEDAMIQSLWFCHEGPVLDFQVPKSYYAYTGEHSEYEYRYLRSSENANGLGIAKTHEMLVAFDAHEGAPGAAAPLAAFQAPPVCMASPEWMCDSGVFGAVQPYSPTLFPSYEKLLSDNFDAEQRMQAFTRDYGMWNFGDGHTTWDMAKRRWSDVYRTWRNTHHGCCRVPWLLYFHSGDPKYFSCGVRNARHVLDEDFCHWTTPDLEKLEYPKGKIKGALNDYKGIVHWHSGNRLMDYNSMADFALWYYHMTGDRWGLEIPLEWAEAVKKRFAQPFGSREGSGTMSALIDVHQETWNPGYRRIIDAFFEHMTTKEQNHGQDKKTPIGSFPQWENYAPWLERYCDLTGDPRAQKALVAWANAYLEGYGDACSTMGIGDYVNILGYAYLFTRDVKYLSRGVWEADKNVKTMYSGDDPLLKGLMQAAQTSHSGYMIQRLPIFMKALAVHGKPVEPDMLFPVRPGFQLLFERTRPVIKGKSSKVETVEAWILEPQDQDLKITLSTSHSYEKREYTVRVLSPSGKDAAKVVETYPRGKKDTIVTVPKDGETGVYRMTVAAEGSMGQVSHPIGLEPALPVAFPLKGRIVPLMGAQYFFFVPKNVTKVAVSCAVVGSGAGRAQVASPDGKLRVNFEGQSDPKRQAAVPPDQAGACWKLSLDGNPSQLSLVAEGGSIPPLLFQSAYPAEQCEVFANAVK